MPKRKQKIPMISLRGVTPFVLTPDQWKQLEALYRYDLDVQVRKEIVSATGEFLAFARAEKTGLMSHATGRVKRFSKMASQLLDVINDRRIEDVTRRYVDDEISMFAARRAYVHDFTKELSSFVSNCDLALRHMMCQSGLHYWPDGLAWDVWARKLTDILDQRGLPTAARKDVDKNRTACHSPFVEFLFELQAHIPNEFRLRHSREALAGAINKARRMPKPPVARKKRAASK